MIDKEWEDGDDSARYDEGYLAGVMDAYNYVVDELGFELSDSDILKNLGVQTVEELNNA
jgi:hypothetical protein